MTIDEKLSHFYDITVEEAHEKAAAILEEHKASLEKMAEEHKTLSEENAQTQIKAETASARREMGRIQYSSFKKLHRNYRQSQAGECESGFYFWYLYAKYAWAD